MDGQDGFYWFATVIVGYRVWAVFANRAKREVVPSPLRWQVDHEGSLLRSGCHGSAMTVVDLLVDFDEGD